LQEAAEQALDDLDVGRRLGWKKCTDRIEELREPTEDDTPEVLAASLQLATACATARRSGSDQERGKSTSRAHASTNPAAKHSACSASQNGASVSRSSAAANAVMASRTN